MDKIKQDYGLEGQLYFILTSSIVRWFHFLRF